MSKEVATKQSTEITAYDAELEALIRADVGKGVSLEEKDNIVPGINVLQGGSPEVQEGPEQIAGAVAGDFYLANADVPIIKGKEGFLFQPCGKSEWWFEYIPRENGGGFQGKYPVEYHNGLIVPPKGAEKYPDKQQKFYFPSNGNNCTHYKFVTGILWKNGMGLEYVIPFFSTGHTVVKMWNTKWTRKRTRDDRILACYSHIYRLTTTRRSNKFGSWYSIETDEGTPIAIEDAEGHMVANPAVKKILGDPMKGYLRGRALEAAVNRGEKIEGVTQQAEDNEIPF
jgi:hypothetical protein